MKLKTIAVIGMAVSLSLTGCGAIINSTTQSVRIDSNPGGAKVMVDGQEYGATPLAVSLARKKVHVVRIELNGYEPMEYTLNKKISGWVWGSLLLGGLIGVIIDVASGGVYVLTPEQLSAELQSGQSSAVRKDGTIYIATVMKAGPSWQKIGEMKRIN